MIVDNNFDGKALKVSSKNGKPFFSVDGKELNVFSLKLGHRNGDGVIEGGDVWVATIEVPVVFASDEGQE